MKEIQPHSQDDDVPLHGEEYLWEKVAAPMNELATDFLVKGRAACLRDSHLVHGPTGENPLGIGTR